MKRELYHNLVKWKAQSPRKPLILRGVRQCGKTYLLQHFGKQAFSRTHYLNFEKDKSLATLFESNLEPKSIIEKLNFYFDTAIDLQNDLIIFDEIQDCPRALTSLKYFAEEMPEVYLVAAGSLLGVHLAPVSFPVGKVEFMDLYPLSFREFLLALEDVKSVSFLDECDLKKETPSIIHQHLWERLKWYFIVGGLPEVVKTFRDNRDSLFGAFDHVRAMQETLIATYLADMAKHAGKVNAMHLDRVWRAIPSQLARTQDGSAARFQFRGIIPGIDRYQRLVNVIDWLEAANLIIKVPIVKSGELPFTAYAEDSHFKLFLFDVGLLGALSSLPPKTLLDYDYGTYKGYFAENYVAQAFMSSNGSPFVSWQEKRAEVEFLRIHNGDVIPIEVKSGGVTKAQSLQKFVEKYRPPYRVICSANKLHVDNTHTVHKYPLYLAHRFPFD